MKNLLHILSFFAACLAYGQVSLVVEPSKKEILQNEPLVLNFYLEIKGEGLSQETPLRLVDTSKFTVLSSNSEQSSFRDPRTGIITYQMVYQYILMPRKTGKIKIGSSSVVVDSKLYYTEPFDILVRENERKQVVAERINKDLYLNVELGDESVYQNQPTVAVLRAYSKNVDNFRKVRNIRLPEEDQFDLKAVSFAKSEIEPQGNMASQIMAVFLIFPYESGKMEVPAVTASIAKGRTISSNKPRLHVKKLPVNAPAAFRNAVGKFDLQMKQISTEKAEVEKPIKVSVKLSGEGNLGNLKMPEIRKSDDYKVFNPHITTQMTTDRKGLRGDVIANYVIVPKKSGPITISTEKFVFFNPETKAYTHISEKSLNINAYTHDELIELQTPLEKVNEYSNVVLESVNNPVLKTEQLKVQHKNKFQWNTVMLNVGLLGIALAGLLAFRKFRSREKIKAHSVAGPVENIADKEEEIRKEFEVSIEDQLQYLRSIKNERNYQKFFAVLEEIDQMTASGFNVSPGSAFHSYLEQNYGPGVTSEYRNLQQQIQMEKYAPMHDDVQIDQIFAAVYDFYLKIKK